MQTNPLANGSESHLRVVTDDVLDKTATEDPKSIEDNNSDWGEPCGYQGSDEPEEDKPKEPPKEVKKYSTPTPLENTVLEPYEFMIRAQTAPGLSLADKMVLIKIRQLSIKRPCEATNEQITEYLDSSIDIIKRSLTRLHESLYINITNPRSKYRKIWCSAKLD